jgi:hypothetical protein
MASVRSLCGHPRISKGSLQSSVKRVFDDHKSFYSFKPLGRIQGSSSSHFKPLIGLLSKRSKRRLGTPALLDSSELTFLGLAIAVRFVMFSKIQLL